MSDNGHSEAIVIPQYAQTSAMIAAQIPRQLDQAELAEWIVEKAQPGLGREQQCCLFTLTHDSDRGPCPITQEVIGKQVTPEMRDRLAAKIAAMFATASKNKAEGVGSPVVQRFVVGAHVKNHRDEHAVFQYIFVVTPPPEIAAQAAEQTGVTGMIGHMQRLAGDMAKLLSVHVQESNERLANENRQLRERLDKAEAERWEMFLKHEALADGRELREVTTYKTKLEMEFQNKLLMSAFELGAQLVKQHFHLQAEKNPMLEFVQILEPDQLVGFVQGLNPKQRAAFDELLPTLLESMPEEKRQLLAGFIASQMQVRPEPEGESE